jgi:dTDP-4-amino-4,6-dideoxygalactose transaminase
MPLPIPRHIIPMDLPEVALAARLAAGSSPGEDALVRFTDAVGRRLGVPHVVPIASGRRALALALHALQLKPGARVGVPTYCFPALVRVFEAYGYQPVFVPIGADTLAIDPDGLRRVVASLDAVMGIEPFGQICGVPDCESICDEAGVPLIEDASQSTGAIRDGRPAGSWGRVGVFSMVDGKNLQAFGGGLLTTHDADLAARARARLGPTEGSVAADFRGGLARAALSARVPFAAGPWPALRARASLDPDGFDTMFDEPDAPFDAADPLRAMSPARAAFALLNLQRLDERNLRRREVARLLFAGLDGVDGLSLQRPGPGTHTYNAFPVRVRDGATFARRLMRFGVDVRRDYMAWFTPDRAFDEDVVYLPSHPGMDEADARRVVAAVRSVLGAHAWLDAT